ncbi:MAG TPA: hypothetical protein VNH22_17210 [Blastocatellia bacterium]|jgi:hypothetical protein|nr:hypothetical protein [Blastocatellia bacterium]
MAEGQDYSSIGPLDAAAQKEGVELVGTIALVMVATVAVVYIVGAIVNAIT